MTKIAEKTLPILIGAVIRRMSDREKIVLSNLFTWEELEEWKATAETLSDRHLTKKIRKGLDDEKRGRIRPVALKC